MASADDLADIHDRAQSALGRRTAAKVLALWDLLDPNNLDTSSFRWLSAALGEVLTAHQQSALLAQRFIDRYRALVLPESVPLPPLTLPPPQTQAIATSLRVVGPVSIKAAMARGVPLDRAVRTAQTMVGRAAQRHVLTGGDQVIVDALGRDPEASGWRRRLSGDSCKFCTAPENQTGRGAFRRHDGCDCRPVPAYGG